VLEVDVSKRLGPTLIEAAFTAKGGITALFGPSGSGKTSIVNMVAGLITPERGRIALGGEVLFDSAAHKAVPVHKRRIGYVFQDDRLFPHLSVRHNLAFGRWMNRRAHDRAEEVQILDLLGIGPLMGRRPAGLSGGEKQRVAIGRALLSGPKLLLLDEPLASLDAARKAEILPYLERLRDQTGIPMVYVSHSAEEVERLADTIVRLEAGRVVAVEDRSSASARVPERV
jgi:molybdate transport system ATP-binding protein